ncbi:MAG: tRNA wybutosine-synthesizing 3 family protein [Nanoarchaeota archaeon]
MITFQRRKTDCLSKDDKSSIGSWDKPIVKLCEKINKKKEFYTLSSCSGRIVLVKNLDKKQPNMFVFRSHEKVSFQELKKKLLEAEKNKESLIFKQEPPILHICCAKLEGAEEFLEKARESGWKNSGIMSTRGRIVLELRSTEYLALPIMEKGRLLVDDEFLKILVRESNKRMEKSWEKINRFERII